MNIKRVAIILLSLVALITSSHAAYADGVQRKQHNKNFVLDSRKVYIKGSDPVTTKMVSSKIQEHGATVTNDFISKIFGARIIFQSTSKIENSSSGYSIEVSPSKVAIKFTSAEMLDYALEEFNKLFIQSGSTRVINGCDILCIDNSYTNNSLTINSYGVIDGISNELSQKDIIKEMKTRIEKQRKLDFILAVANRNVYRVNFKILEGLNPSYNGIAEGWTYSTDEIKEYVTQARQNGGEFIPAIDFLSQNERFEQYTGHTIDSPEGMRFVRAIIEECANDWGIKKLCIGTKSKITVEPYILDFLESVAQRENIELIVI